MSSDSPRNLPALVSLSHHELGAVRRNCGFSKNMAMDFRAQQLLIPNSFNSTEASADLWSELWYPHNLWTASHWCLGVVAWHERGNTKRHFRKPSTAPLFPALFPGLRWISDIFFYPICLNPLARGDPGVRGGGRCRIGFQMTLYVTSHSQTDHRKPQDLSNPRPEGGPTNRDSKTKHDCRLDGTQKQSCTWEADHAVCSGSEGQERHNHFQSNSGLSRRGQYDTMNSLGSSRLNFSGNKVCGLLWKLQLQNQEEQLSVTIYFKIGSQIGNKM